MKHEYDFSAGERGKFYRENAVFKLPIWLEADVLAFFDARAQEQDCELEQLVNDVLRREMSCRQAGAKSPPEIPLEGRAEVG
jgi:hypothetical protein